MKDDTSIVVTRKFLRSVDALFYISKFLNGYVKQTKNGYFRFQSPTRKESLSNYKSGLVDGVFYLTNEELVRIMKGPLSSPATTFTAGYFPAS